MEKSLKRSIWITLVFMLISALSGAAFFPAAILSSKYSVGAGGILFIIYLLSFFVTPIYGSGQVIFHLPCNKYLRMLFFFLWLIFYFALSYMLLFLWFYITLQVSDIC